MITTFKKKIFQSNEKSKESCNINGFSDFFRVFCELEAQKRWYYHISNILCRFPEKRTEYCLIETHKNKYKKSATFYNSCI